MALCDAFLFPRQALSLKEAEKAVLADKVSALQAELTAAVRDTERTSREAALYKEQEQVMSHNPGALGFYSSGCYNTVVFVVVVVVVSHPWSKFVKIKRFGDFRKSAIAID